MTNAELFNRQSKTHIAVWDSEIGVRRAKRANPDLMVYVPAVVEPGLIRRSYPSSSPSFFLVGSEDPDMRNGREIARAQLFTDPEFAQAA